MTTHWQDYTAGLELSLNPYECALLVIDVQDMFCSPTGVTGRKHANTRMQALPAKINTFAETFRKAGGLPIYIRAVTDAESRPQNMKWLDKIKGASFPTNPDHSDYSFYGLDIPKDAITLEKRCGDAFTSTDLKQILDAHSIKNVLLSGVRTEICVRRAAERASGEGYFVLVLRDLCATRDACAEHEDQALMFLNAYSGLVTTTEEMKKMA